MSANFIPSMESYSGQKPFRYWCQTVLPLVYDDSLSYYELLNKVVFYLNHAIDDVSAVETNVTALLEAYEQLQDYVNTYFDNVDIEAEIDQKLDDMVANGELTPIMRPIIVSQVTTWLENNITPTEPAIDASLSVSGAGADAKVVGDNFKSTLYGRGTLASTDDLDELLEPGIYFCSVDQGLPINTPTNKTGRLLVVKSGTQSVSRTAQLYFTINESNDEAIYYRIAKTEAYPSNAWNGISWVKIAEEESVEVACGAVDSEKNIPLMLGTIVGAGRYGASISDNRLMPINTLMNYTDFCLAGHKIKFYYYSDRYAKDIYNNTQNPSSYLGTSSWMNIDTPVSPELGKWFIFLIAKQDDSTLDGSDIQYIRSNLTYKCKKDKDIYYQVESVPYNAVTYHALWDDFITECNKSVSTNITKTLLGKVNNSDDYPIYAYELHTVRNWVTSGYQRVVYNGTNAMYPRKKILILSGAHGNEKNCPMDVLNLAKELVSGRLQNIGAMFDWYIIPLTNPWGYSNVDLDANGNIIYRGNTPASSTVPASYDKNAGVRRNYSGHNINRDYSDNTFTMDNLTYGWQTAETQIMKTYLLANKWDIFLDVHQSGEDRDAGMPRLNTYAGIAWKTSTDTEYNDKINKQYRLIGSVSGKLNEILQDHFDRCHNYQVASVWKRESGDDTLGGDSPSGTACSYFGGIERDNTGNTEHQNIAADVAFTLETSQIAYSYSADANEWFNPIACTCSSTALCYLVEEIGKYYGI